jgi:cysteinyl-tRNA synthetase
MNITDIDDKTIRDSGEEGITLQELTDRYTASFLKGIDALNILRATVYPRATDYVPQMIDFVKELVEKGVAYEAGDGVYFDIDKFPEYGKLSGINLEKVESRDRTSADEYDKESVNDFALWKKSTQDELSRGIFYESPWGPGRPGWHIECSVMTRSLMGDTIDIHAGGEDLVFPHHENEMAQSETLTGKLFVRYWVHIRHLMINGRTMSKSLGNYVSFEEAISTYSSDALRYFYLTTHYRKPLDYTEAAMKSALNSTVRLNTTLDLIEETMNRPDTRIDFSDKDERFLNEIQKQINLFEKAMDNDLDTHGALDSLHAVSGIINEYVSSPANKGVLLKASKQYHNQLNILGLFETKTAKVEGLTEKVVKILIETRANLRENKNYEQADRIREQLKDINVILTDKPNGSNWKLKNR